MCEKRDKYGFRRTLFRPQRETWALKVHRSVYGTISIRLQLEFCLILEPYPLRLLPAVSNPRISADNIPNFHLQHTSAKSGLFIPCLKDLLFSLSFINKLCTAPIFAKQSIRVHRVYSRRRDICLRSVYEEGRANGGREKIIY